jgi:cAMP-dependent protein kinase regulator
MVLGWRSRAKASSVDELVAQKAYAQAIDLINAELKEHSKNERLRLQLAHLLALAGKKDEALSVLDGLANDLANDGFAAKAIAVLKKMQRLEPSHSGIDERLATLIDRKAPPAPEAWVDSSPQPELGIEIGEPAPAGLSESGELTPPPEKAAATAPATAPSSRRRGTGALETPLFRGMSQEEILAVIRGLRFHSTGPGRILVTEGEPGDSLFILTTGLCRAYVRNPAGHNMEVRELTEGDFFGEISVLTGQARSATITTVTPCELLELDRQGLEAITASYPRVREVLQEFHAWRADSTIEAAIRGLRGN